MAQTTPKVSYGAIPEYKLKADIPHFQGNFKIEKFLDWVHEVEEFFDFMEIPNKKKLKLDTYKLKGGAAAWRTNLVEERRLARKAPIRSWQRSHDLLRDKFLPKDWRQQLFAKLQNCQQGARPVEEYVTDFYTLVARNNLKENEQLISRFIEDLNQLIRHGMVTTTHTMVDTIQMLLGFKAIINHTLNSVVHLLNPIVLILINHLQTITPTIPTIRIVHTKALYLTKTLNSPMPINNYSPYTLPNNDVLPS